MNVDESDLKKILSVLCDNETFHRSRDKMNASLHLAKEVLYSPLTVETINAARRLQHILETTK